MSAKQEKETPASLRPSLVGTVSQKTVKVIVNEDGEVYLIDSKAEKSIVIDDVLYEFYSLSNLTYHETLKDFLGLE